MVWFVGESYGLVGTNHFVTNGGNFLPAELPGIATLLDQVRSNGALKGSP